MSAPRISPREIAATLQADAIDWLVTVPASGLDDLYAHFEARSRCLYATREEEAIAIATGMALGGGHPVVVMQQSGVGNCLNAVFTLSDAYAIQFSILVFFRSLRDPNPVQQTSSERTVKVLTALGMDWIDLTDSSAGIRLKDSLARGARWIALE